MTERHFNIRYEFSPEEVRKQIDRRCKEPGGAYVVVADGNILTMVHKDEEYRKTVDGAMFSICDSSWVPLYLKLIHGFKPVQYCGSDIFADMVGAKKYTMAFLGTSQETLDALKAELCGEDPRIADMHFEPLPFCDADGFDYGKIAEGINSFSPDIVWVALGAPKQERFAERLAPHLRRGVIIPVGAVFNFRAGLGIRRAPDWMVKCHLEFAYRIASEPRKQFKRVWRILTATPAIIAEEARTKKRSRKDSAR